MAINRYYLYVSLLFTAMLFSVKASGQSKLQQHLDNLAGSQTGMTRGGDAPTIIDLSEFDSDVTEPLYVRNGINVEFRNGKLIRRFEGNLVIVKDNSTLTIGEGTSLLSQSVQGEYLVLVNEGKLCVNDGIIDPRSLDGSTVTAGGKIYSGMRTVSLIKPTDELELNGGKIFCDVNADESYVVCRKGSCYELSAKNVIVDMEEEMSLPHVFVSNLLFIRNKILNGLTIYCKKTYGAVIAQGDNGYKLSKSDVDNISVVSNIHPNGLILSSGKYDGWNYSTKLEGNKIYLCEEGIKDAQTLQEALDAIAAKNIDPSKREIIEIPTEGIEIDESIYFRKNCRVILKGGPIRISSNFKINPVRPYPYYAFVTEAGSAVEFQDITLDFNNNNIFKRCLFEINGMFYVKNNVEFKNIDKNIDLQYGIFYMKDGCYFSYDNPNSEINVNPTVFYGEGVQEAYFSGYAASYNKPVVNSQSIFNVMGGKIQSNYAPYSIKCSCLSIRGNAYLTSVSETVADAERIYVEGGYVSGKCLKAKNIDIYSSGNSIHHFYLDKIAIQDVLSMYGNINIECPVSFENVDSRITINQAITCTSKIKFISPCWKDLLNKPLISGTTKYPLPDNILNDFDFSESGYKAVLDKEKNCVILKKKSLQDALDDAKGNGGGTSDNPIEFDLPDEEEVENDIHFPDGLQGVLDGLADTENGDNIPKQLKLGGGCVFVDKNCALTIRNYILDGCSSGKRIYVDGTLTIDVNVYIRYFSDYFIHVRQGGCVIWRGGRTEVINKVVYNEGGTIIIESGEINAGGGSAIENVGGTIEIFGGETSDVVLNGTITNGTIYYGGTIRIYGGSYNGPITNYGTLVIYNGTYNNGGVSSTVIKNYGELHINGGIVNGGIYGYSDFHLCGCANVGDIYLRGGSKMYVTERLTEKLRIHVFIEGAINNGAEIVIGSGYVLTEDDLKFIELVLPDGFEWEYDSFKHVVIIKNSTGLEDVTMDKEACIYDIYSLQGMKVGTTVDKMDIPDGIYVIGGKKAVLINKEK